MSPLDEEKNWASILEAVRSFHALCALVVLVLGSAFVSAIVKGCGNQLLIPLLIAFLAIVAASLYYFVTVDRGDLTFRIKISQSSQGALLPVGGLKVALFKNGKQLRDSDTDENGEVSFTERLARSDELYVIVGYGNTLPRKAQLYSEGQFQVVKAITI